MENYIIRPETPADHFAVEYLTREAFWNVYHPGCSEHFVLHQFRDRPEFIRELDLVLEVGGEIIGHIMFVHSNIKTESGVLLPIVTFGPISISPEKQGQGWGTILLRYAMEQTRNMGFGAIAITGNPAFYGKSGFVAGKDLGIVYEEDPEADYFLIAELKPGFLSDLSGTFRDPEGYFVQETDVEEFDRRFPQKEKKKLPGQLS